jgi:HlyD family secretion protein
MDGFVVQKNAEIGQVTGSGGPPLFIIASDRSKMQVLAAVAEGDISRVKRGNKTRFTVQAYSDKTFGGAVSEIYLQPSIVQNVVNYLVVIDVNNKEGLLLPGMTATIDIITDSRTNILKVPNSVLKFRPTQQMFRELFGNSTNSTGNRYRGANQGMTNRQFSQQGMRTNQQNGSVLWVSDEKTGRVQPIRVKLGMSDGQMTEIESDRISEGMSVISGLSNQNGQSGRNLSPSTSPFQGSFPGGRGPR